MARVDLTGQVFGKLTVLSHQSIGGIAYCICSCECGNTTTKRTHGLIAGSTRSCGCLKKQCGNRVNHTKITRHHLSRSPVYKIWAGMKQRCLDPNNLAYKDYGGRGISVCEEWIDDFRNFYRDMGDRPDGMSIDRINNDGNYCRENCRWATDKQQANNKRNCRKVTIDGITKGIAQWEDENGLTRGTVSKRLKHGLTGEALIRGSHYKNIITINGVSKWVMDWAKESGLSRRCILKRIERGWSESELLTPTNQIKYHFRNHCI